jgi:hypothetical protein
MLSRTRAIHFGVRSAMTDLARCSVLKFYQIWPKSPLQPRCRRGMDRRWPVSRGSTYGISRVDNETSRTHGWLVTIQRRGVIYRKHFSDGVFGGKPRSFAAAKAYRDEIIAAHPPLSMQEYSNIVKKNNRSGVVGVCRYCASETRDLPEEKQRWFWVASWPLPDGRRKRVKFSVKKYGEDGAFRMAMDARSTALGKLVGAFDPGAIRRKTTRRRPVSAAVSP